MPAGSFPRFTLCKADKSSDIWHPLEAGQLVLDAPAPFALRVTLRDASGRIHGSEEMKAGTSGVAVTPRGNPGWQTLEILAAGGGPVLGTCRFRMAAATSLTTDDAAMEGLFRDLTRVLAERRHEAIELDGRRHAVEIGWSRDHAYTLKSARYFRADVNSGTELWLRTQRPDGSFWDCFHPNPSGAPNWFCEALGGGWFRYYENGTLMARRIPIEADVEYCIAEAVFHAWQATGDDAWARRWLPALDAALRHTTTHPLRWSARHGLVKRSFCMDSWDFAHPAYCDGDHRCLHPGDPSFLFHGDNSGLYQFLRQLACLHEAVGDAARAGVLRGEASALRERANAVLYRPPNYGHMIPEELPEADVFARVGDERARMSLSTGYTINRGLPDHAMAVAILDEYQRRREARRGESWAEWWTMDPPYSPHQWPQNGPQPGDYMNGGICLIAAGELAMAAARHGREACAADILRRVAALPAADGGTFAAVYRRLPTDADAPIPGATPLDLKPCANRGLRHGAHPGVAAWTDEGENDLRNLPVGDQQLAGIPFHILNPEQNSGRSVLFLDRADAPVRIAVPDADAHAGSLAFLHATVTAAPPDFPVAFYRLCYADGSTHPVPVRTGHEIAHWWGASADMIAPPGRYDAPVTAALGWQGANPKWKTTGVFVFSAQNPFPEKQLSAIEIDPSPLLARPRGGLLVCAVSAVHAPAGLGLRTRSGGLPLCWALSSVFDGLMGGLAGIEDVATGFRRVRIAPRWTATPARHARACLHYPASDAYCLCDFVYDPAAAAIRLDLAGSFDHAGIHLLLPEASGVASVTLAGSPIPFTTSEAGSSRYLDFTLESLPTSQILISLLPGCFNPSKT